MKIGTVAKDSLEILYKKTNMERNSFFYVCVSLLDKLTDPLVTFKTGVDFH